MACSARSADRAARAPACGPGSELVTRISTIARAIRDRYQTPPPAVDGLQRELPRRFQQLEPLHLIRLGLLQIVGLDPDRDMPAAHRDAQLPGPVEQVLIDRRARHQQLGQQLAPGADRQLARPPCQVEQLCGGEGRGVQDEPGADTGVAERMRSGEIADRRLPDHDRCADFIRRPAARRPAIPARPPRPAR